MLSKQYVLDLITVEKNKYSEYIQLCAYYEVKPDELVIVQSATKLQTLEFILKTM